MECGTVFLCYAFKRFNDLVVTSLRVPDSANMIKISQAILRNEGVSLTLALIRCTEVDCR